MAFGTKEQKGRRRLLSGNRKQVEADTSVYSTATSKIQLVIVGDVNSPFEIELELLIDFFSKCLFLATNKKVVFKNFGLSQYP